MIDRQRHWHGFNSGDNSRAFAAGEAFNHPVIRAPFFFVNHFFPCLAAPPFEQRIQSAS